ncbi:heat shock protein Hsp20 domain-containing protein [Tieghemostelium lacteum]|uniref:Heat shock protein Hsp20 domain-containing protein n=1 Tax=Tieghemostelium lacteum TaxID=361077 RepID=A0A152A839_TIELA|nr:heat shock protein Hsp20 domain-containing protein [Tieghemostelium lacteum]|eukprot:KYR02364.1 heat shock protein Hsp20 domain-containing protein [Tieghemostelium lacteum]
MSCKVFYNRPNPFYFNHIYNELVKQQQQQLANQDRFYTPNSNIIDTEDAYIVELELAGVDKQDIKIDIEKSTLVISGENKRKSAFLTKETKVEAKPIVSNDQPSIEEFEDDLETSTTTTNNNNITTSTTSNTEKPKETTRYLVQEIDSGKFKKVLSIKENQLDLTKINATFENGILTVKLLKKEPVSLKVNIQ